jgi:hypothetical protein
MWAVYKAFYISHDRLINFAYEFKKNKLGYSSPVFPSLHLMNAFIFIHSNTEATDMGRQCSVPALSTCYTKSWMYYLREGVKLPYRPTYETIS